MVESKVFKVAINSQSATHQKEFIQMNAIDANSHTHTHTERIAIDRAIAIDAVRDHILHFVWRRTD